MEAALSFLIPNLYSRMSVTQGAGVSESCSSLSYAGFATGPFLPHPLETNYWELSFGLSPSASNIPAGPLWWPFQQGRC